MSTNELGIENFKKGVRAAVNVVEIAVELINNFSIQNLFTKLGSIIFEIGFYQSVIREAAVIWAEAKDTDVGEAYEMYTYFKEEFDIENDEMEAKVEKALAYAPKLYELISAVIPAAKQVAAPGLETHERIIAIGSLMEIAGKAVKEVGLFIGEEKAALEVELSPKFYALEAA